MKADELVTIHKLATSHCLEQWLQWFRDYVQIASAAVIEDSPSQASDTSPLRFAGSLRQPSASNEANGSLFQ